MELDPFFVGAVSLLSGFSGADRIFVGEFKGAALKAVLFVAATVLLVKPTSSIQELVGLWAPMQALQYFSLAWWIFDALTVFSKMYDVAPSTTLFGVSVRWGRSSSVRTTLAYTLFFVLLFVVLSQ